MPLLLAGPAAAGPWFESGDERLRSDIQLLADAGVIQGPVSTWPLSWEDLTRDTEAGAELQPWQRNALARVREAAETARGGFGLEYTAHASIAENPVQFRGFSNTPREDGEVGGGIVYSSDSVAVNLQASWAKDPGDGKRFRADGSYATVALGNWLVSASAQERWWGPGWSNSLIYSNNARPVPSISLDRNFTTPFSNRWLNWLGHWDLSMQVGHLENDRAVPEALLYSLRVTARPTRGLEIGVSRTAQLCGESRTCGLKTWGRMLLGKDNRDDNVSRRDEPGNQLAGWDVRWSGTVGRIPYATYTQWIGEDEGGGLPAKYTALLGAETWGGYGESGTYRVFLEWTDTMCNFALYKGSDNVVPDCTYNNDVYESGYRYRGRSLASSFDNDASVFTLGTLITHDDRSSWQLNLQYGNLNRKGSPDPGNTVATDKTRYRAVLVTHRRATRLGEFYLGAGYDDRRNLVTRTRTDDVNLFLEWRNWLRW